MKKLMITAGAAALLFVAAADSNVFGQGNSGGNRGGGGGNSARPSNPGGGPPSGTGVGRGLGTASERSNGRSDDGLGNASTRSNGRSDTGINRARLASDRADSMSDNELNRYRGLSRKLGITPEEMRARYEAALLSNPDLKYGQFVSANVVADNLMGRYPKLTAERILIGYQNGDSLGRTLKSFGLSGEQAKDAERLAEVKIKEAKKRNK